MIENLWETCCVESHNFQPACNCNVYYSKKPSVGEEVIVKFDNNSFPGEVIVVLDDQVKVNYVVAYESK